MNLSNVAVAEDLMLLEEAEFDPSEIISAYTENESIYYKYQTTNNVLSDISVSRVEDDIVMEIYEGDLHDTLTFCKDGTILFNGKEPTITTYDENGNIISEIGPNRAGSPNTYQYDENPFGGLNPRDYNKHESTKYTSIDTEEKIVKMTVAAIQVALKSINKIMFGAGAAVLNAVLSYMFEEASETIHSKALIYAPDSNSIGVRWLKYVNDDMAGYEIYDYRNELYYYSCEVSAGYAPIDQFCGLSTFYERVTIF